ncbi:ABC transporter permease [Stygiolobus caldivivus]|uniref:Peptide transporter permease n=1 Tax=Stygiolobus caldivivus TaxID=2824673 RepID=A0A8D5U8R6_9CREN|nr:ABC transporter permease [Stygiolobus caldivivus]BCU71448.1 peptide transporter permease [Stygiolobus caldivivus]
MKLSILLIVVSLLLLLLGISLSVYAVQQKFVELYNFGYGKLASPPENWQDCYWAILVRGYPNATIFYDNHLIQLNNISNYSLPSPGYYTYIISGYIQPYAFLSPLSMFMTLTGTLIGFKGTTLFFQERILGEDLVKGYAVGGSLSRYVLKRLSSALVSLSIVFILIVVLEYFHGRNPYLSLLEFLEFNAGISSYFKIDATSLILTSLAYTAMLLGISFSLTVYLSAFLVIYGLENPLVSKIMDKWKYIGSALASWVFAMIIIYALHFFTGLLPYGTPKGEILPYLVMPVISLFFPFIGIFANRMLSTIPKSTASVKGLDKKVIIYRHVLGNATVVMLSTISSAFVEMLLAELLVEGIFQWPGFGLLLKYAVFNGDYKVIEGSMLTYSTLTVLSNFITDVVYGILDPRVTR